MIIDKRRRRETVRYALVDPYHTLCCTGFKAVAEETAVIAEYVTTVQYGMMILRFMDNTPFRFVSGVDSAFFLKFNFHRGCCPLPLLLPAVPHPGGVHYALWTIVVYTRLLRELLQEWVATEITGAASRPGGPVRLCCRQCRCSLLPIPSSRAHRRPRYHVRESLSAARSVLECARHF